MKEFLTGAFLLTCLIATAMFVIYFIAMFTFWRIIREAEKEMKN
jgi:hypothetical protein